MGRSEPIQFKMPPSQASIWLAVLRTCLQANRVANVLLVNAFAGIPHHCLSQSSFVSSAWQPHSDVTCKHCLASVYNLWGSFHGFMSTISSQRKHRLLWNAWHMMHHDTWKLLMENLTLILRGQSYSVSWRSVYTVSATTTQYNCRKADTAAAMLNHLLSWGETNASESEMNFYWVATTTTTTTSQEWFRYSWTCAERGTKPKRRVAEPWQQVAEPSAFPVPYSDQLHSSSFST